MTQLILSLVPADRHFMPLPEKSLLARRVVTRAMPEAAGGSEVDEVFLDEVIYFATGEEIEDADCPVCGESLCEEIDWWSTAMEAARETGFSDIEARTPCCRAHIKLTQLYGTGAFARYGLTIRNPPPGFLTPRLKHELEDTLGAPLKAVYLHT